MKIYKQNGYLTDEFLEYLTQNAARIWPKRDMSNYSKIKVHQYGSAKAGYIECRGINQAGVNVEIGRALLNGHDTCGVHTVFANEQIIEVTNEFLSKQ